MADDVSADDRPAGDQPTANAERGEHELTLAGTLYRLRPSHSALKAIEKKTERATLSLVRLGNTGDLTLGQMGIIAAELIRAGADRDDRFTRNISAERIEELIFEEGLPHATSRLTLCLLDAATGGRDASGDVKAAEAT
ncbi:gene transfer agent family protein [Sphingomonas sp. Leaf37]|uniref:gene transfer agent family protein n=1 Tax=Sphingomonas sp. Leaf37 TaxID=2876552 RepID=UPI001E5B7BEC|nr:gene transfer agent family protein [Sphingomonas sp. Leaf37]